MPMGGGTAIGPLEGQGAGGGVEEYDIGVDGEEVGEEGRPPQTLRDPRLRAQAKVGRHNTIHFPHQSALTPKQPGDNATA